MSRADGSANGGDGSGKPARILVVGGAGFVGTNLAHRLLKDGHRVRILDALLRPGSEQNIQWLTERFAQRLEFVKGDVRDYARVRAAVEGIDHIYHLAAQVAVTASLVSPQEDFSINAQGTLNLLEAARSCAHAPSIAFSSTNKVYGALADIEVQATGKRYVPVDHRVRTSGIGESRALEFHSPYGCSKGAAEQYVLDYSRTFGLRTVVLRMSCIYGPHQHGNEDQGWVAHFVRCALGNRPITIYGDGLQVRDILFVEDLVDAFECSRLNIDHLSGRAFNIGGGPANAVSILELTEHIERITHLPMDLSFDKWRVGDQRYYVSDITRYRTAVGWKPRTNVPSGLLALCEWLEGTMPDVRLHSISPGRSAPIIAGAQP